MTAPESYAGNTQGDPRLGSLHAHRGRGPRGARPGEGGRARSRRVVRRRYWEPEGILQPPQRGFARTTNELYFGNPAVDIVVDRGPYAAKPPADTPSRRDVFVCRPATRDVLKSAARARSCPGSPAAPIGGRSPNRTRDAARFLRSGPAPKTDSKPASSAGCGESWPRRASCSASSASRRTRARHRSIASVTSSWRRGSRSSCGAAFPTTSC